METTLNRGVRHLGGSTERQRIVAVATEGFTETRCHVAALAGRLLDVASIG